MPDISDLDSLIEVLMLSLMLPGDEKLPPKTRLYRRNFVRLIDKAVLEYGRAQGALCAQTEEPNRPAEELLEGRELYIFTFANHLENCLNAIRRLLNHLDKLKSDRGGIEIDRTIRNIIESASRSLIDIRDTVEHLDERIQKDEIGPKESIMLSVTDDQRGAEIAGTTISFAELERIIRRLHEVGKRMAMASRSV